MKKYTTRTEKRIQEQMYFKKNVIPKWLTTIATVLRWENLKALIICLWENFTDFIILLIT